MTVSGGSAMGGDVGRTVTVYGGCLDAGAPVLSAATEVGQLLAEQRVRIVYVGGTTGPAGRVRSAGGLGGRGRHRGDAGALAGAGRARS